MRIGLWHWAASGGDAKGERSGARAWGQVVAVLVLSGVARADGFALGPTSPCAAGRTVYAHEMYSVVDWFAYATWKPDGGLRRALSVSSNDEVIEDIGARLPFEEYFWAGDFPATDDGDHPLPFHPLELSEGALEHLLGFVFEGHSDMADSSLVDSFAVTLGGFRLIGRRRRGFFRR